MMDLTVKKTIIDDALGHLTFVTTSLYIIEIEHSLDKKGTKNKTATHSTSSW